MGLDTRRKKSETGLAAGKEDRLIRIEETLSRQIIPEIANLGDLVLIVVVLQIASRGLRLIDLIETMKQHVLALIVKIPETVMMKIASTPDVLALIVTMKENTLRVVLALIVTMKKKMLLVFMEMIRTMKLVFIVNEKSTRIMLMMNQSHKRTLGAVRIWLVQRLSLDLKTALITRKKKKKVGS